MLRIIEENGEKIVVADKPVLLVEKVEPAGGYKLKLKFSDGAQKVFDFSSLLDTGVFRRLRDKKFFSQAHVEDGVVMWDDSLDIATETLHAEGVAV